MMDNGQFKKNYFPSSIVYCPSSIIHFPTNPTKTCTVIYNDIFNQSLVIPCTEVSLFVYFFYALPFPF